LPNSVNRVTGQLLKKAVVGFLAEVSLLLETVMVIKFSPSLGRV